MDESPTPWSERAIAQLRSAGYRGGSARLAVIRFLDRQACCLSAQEIHDELSALGSRVGLASVYRVVDTLAQKGLVQRIELGDGVTRYEAIRAGEDHHHHLVCDGCGKVESFADAQLEHVIRDVERRSGYAVAAHEIVLRGACTACR